DGALTHTPHPVGNVFSVSEPTRSIEAILEATVKKLRHNHVPDSPVARVYALVNDTADPDEIRKAAGYLLKLALADLDPKDFPDASARVEKALAGASSWVPFFRRGEHDLDGLWKASLTEHAATLKAARVEELGFSVTDLMRVDPG